MTNFVKHAFALLAALCFSIFFTSCGNEVKIKAEADGLGFEYTISGASEFFSLFYADEEYEVTGFDTEGTKKYFEDSGFNKVSARSLESKALKVEGSLSNSKEDPFSKSGMIAKSGNGVLVKLNKETLQRFYESLSDELRSYFDMLMAPGFSDDEMTDEEYIELIAEVYGQTLADELSKAVIKINLVNSNGVEKRQTIRLLDILNIRKEFIFKV